MFSKLVILSVILASGLCTPHGTSYSFVKQIHDGNGLHGNYGAYYFDPRYAGYFPVGHQDFYRIPQYAFKYGVEDPHTHDVKEQAEDRVDGVVKGQYSLLQPDGRVRVVHYSAVDHNGFNADVTYSGYAVHPSYYSYY